MIDPRYLAGIEHFNAGEYFEAHEVWEELWHEGPAADRRFNQSLIQAAVALYHWGNGNTAGALTLYRRGRAKVIDAPEVWHGLQVSQFWDAVEDTLLRNGPLPRIELILEPAPPPAPASLPMTTNDNLLQGFDGVARLFPLPNLVLFPGIDQRLHIFEYRYRQMAADALEGDGRVALVLLAKDWEEQYDCRPEIESVGCLGRIISSEKLEDGRYNLRLQGIARLKIDSELEAPDKLYRMARSSILPDILPDGLGTLSAERTELRQAVLARFDSSSPVHRQLRELFESETPLGRVCDQLAYCLPVPLEMKQQLLAEPTVITRAQILTHALRPPPRRSGTFPPRFSDN